MVVEDEPVLRISAVDMVEEAGFDVPAAANSKAAIKWLGSRSDIGIIENDIDMQPGMDGMKLVTIIHNRWPPFEIILVSGHVNRDDVELPEGGVFSTKPYRPTDMDAGSLIRALHLSSPKFRQGE